MIRSEIKTIVKDTLRGARYVMRHSAGHAGAGSRLAPPLGGLSAIADTLLTSTEEMILIVAGTGPRDEEMRLKAAMEAFGALCRGAAGPRFGAAFRSAHYRLIAAVLVRRGARNAYVSEQALALAAETLALKGGTAAKAVAGGTEAGVPAFAAAAMLALLAAEPLRMADLPPSGADDPFGRAPKTATILSAVLAGAIHASREERMERVEAAVCLDSATDVVEAVFERFEAALTDTAPAARLAALLADLLPVLP